MEKYEVLETIGIGSLGKIKKIRRKEDNKILVWKEVSYKMMDEKKKQQLVSEVNILKDLKNPNIVRYFDRIIDKSNQKIFIVMEYCEGGDLRKLIKNNCKQKEHFQEEFIWKIFMQLVLAFHEIHKRKQGKILHRDIKPENVFFDNQKNVKIGNFSSNFQINLNELKRKNIYLQYNF